MAGITLGYDGVIQLSHGLLNRAVVALYDAGVIPDHWEPEPGAQAFIPGLEIFLAAPAARFDERPGDGVAIEQRFVVRADTIEGELHGRWSAFLPLEIVAREQDGVPLQFLRCDCSALGIDDILVEGEELGLLALPILAGIHGVLTQQVREVPISAPLPGVNLRVAMGKGDEQSFLCLYVNLDGRVGGFTDGTEPLVPQDAAMSKPDVAVAIDRSVYAPRIKAGLAAAGLVANTRIKVNKGKLRKIRLTRDVGVELVDGAIKVTGGVDCDIKSLPDVTGDFTFLFGLTLSGNQVKLTVLDADVDLDGVWAKIVLAVLAGPFAVLLQTAIQAAVEWAIESFAEGQSVGFALPVQTIFVDGVAITNAAASAAPTAVFVEPASVAVRPDCVVFRLNFRFQFDAVAHAEPFFYRAHLGNREFHRPGCPFGDKIGWKNLTLYPTVWAAFADGYDGCGFCEKPWNGDGTGELELSFAGTGAPPAPDALLASFEFRSQYKYAKFKQTPPGAPTLSATPDGFVATWKRELLAPGVWEARIGAGADAIDATFGIKGGKLNKVAVQRA